jgi:hypothetical protein
VIASATRYPILGRSKDHDFSISNLNDFALGNGEAFDSRRLPFDRCVSLYTLDLERSVACFVELPASADLETSPFFFLTQFREASHLIAIPLDEFEKLAAGIDVNDSRLVLIQSVGRCGSTLVSRVFESIESVRSLSEPDAFTVLVGWRGSGLVPESDIKRIADSCVRIFCRPLAASDNPSYFALKFRSQCMEIDDLLAEAFPAARHLHLTREPVSWLDSFYRAFIDPEKVDYRDYRKWIEDIFAPLYPLIQEQVVKGSPMPVWKPILLNWIANSETFRKFQGKGIPYFVADFSELKTKGMVTIRRILDYCGIPIADWSVIEECLSRDSQQGSGIDQALINDPAKRLPQAMRIEARNLLGQYGYHTTK